MRNTKRIKPFLKYIEQEWIKNPDLRFGQLLINLGLIEDTTKDWVKEILDYPLPYEVIREIATWTSYKNDKYKTNYIKDLETSHIKNILKTQKQFISETDIEHILKNELNYRKLNKIK